MIYVLTCCLLFAISYAQINLDSVFATPVDSIHISQPTALLSADPEGNIFTLDPNTGLLTKYFALQHYDSSLTIGGKSQRDEGLLHPVNLQIQNRQRLYILDDVSRLISLFNINLKLISQIDLSLTADGELFPIDMVVTPAEEIFVINQMDNLEYKYSSLNQPTLTFGGLDYGEGALYDPVAIRTDTKNLVYIWDQGDQTVKIFDIYGIYQSSLDVPFDESWNGFEVLSDHLVFWRDQQLDMIYLPNNEKREITLQTDASIMDIAADRNFFYLLTSNAIRLYQISD